MSTARVMNVLDLSSLSALGYIPSYVVKLITSLEKTVILFDMYKSISPQGRADDLVFLFEHAFVAHFTPSHIEELFCPDVLFPVR